MSSMGKQDEKTTPMASHHFPQRSSLYPQVPPPPPPPSAPNNQRKRLLNEPNDVDAKKRQRTSSTTPAPQGTQFSKGMRDSPALDQPAWNVTGHYKVEALDPQWMLNTSTGYEIAIFQYADRQPYQLYARWTLGHLRGLMRFCPHPPRLSNHEEPVSFSIKDFEQACNLKPGDAPGPVHSNQCKNKWIMRWRAFETGMGLGKLVGGENDINNAIDFLRQPDMSFGTRLIWVMVHNFKRVHFTAVKVRELGPESISGLTPAGHWAAFEAEWKYMFDPRWPRGRPSPPPIANPLIPLPQTTGCNALPQNTSLQSVTKKAQQAFEHRDPHALKKEQRNSIPSAATNMTAFGPSYEANTDLSQFLIRIELRKSSHDLNDEATSFITPAVIGLLHDRFQTMSRDKNINISCFHISFDKVKEQIKRFLHLDLTKDDVALGFIQPKPIDGMADRYIQIKLGLTFVRGVEKLHLHHSSGPKQITMYLWSPAPTEPIILPIIPRAHNPAMKPAALTKIPQSQQGIASRGTSAESTKLLGKRKCAYDFTENDDEKPSNHLGIQPSQYSSPYDGPAPSARSVSPSMTQPSFLTPNHPAVSSFIASAESYLASQPNMVNAPGSPGTVPWKAPVANMSSAASASQNHGSGASGRPNFVSHAHLHPPAQFEDVEISSDSEEDIPATRAELLKQDVAKKSFKGKNVPARKMSAPRPQGNPRSASPSTQLHSELQTPRKNGKSLLPKSPLNVAPDNQPQSSQTTEKRGRGRPKGSLNKSKTSTPLTSPAASVTTPGTPIDGNGKKRRGRPPKVRPSLLGQNSSINANSDDQPNVKTEDANDGGAGKVRARGGEGSEPGLEPGVDRGVDRAVAAVERIGDNAVEGAVEKGSEPGVGPGAEPAMESGVDRAVEGHAEGVVEGRFEEAVEGGLENSVENVVEGNGEEAVKGAFETRVESSVQQPVEKASEAESEAAAEGPAPTPAPQLDLKASFGTATRHRHRRRDG